MSEIADMLAEQYYTMKIERLEAEVERLKAALRAIADDYFVQSDEAEGLQEVARAALEGEAMSDIVERLDAADISGHGEYSALAREAKAEIERYRAALQSLTKDPPATFAREPDTDCEVIIKMRAIARAALEGK